METAPYTTTYSIEQLHQITLDYLFVKNVRNMTNHANAGAVEKGGHLKYYTENKYPDMNKMSMQELKQFIQEALEHLNKK